MKTMKTYSVSCEKNTAKKHSRLLSNCAVCGKKKTFIKNEAASRLELHMQ